MEDPPASTPAVNPTEPSPATVVADDQCELRLLMVSGDSFRLVQAANSTVRDLKLRVIADKPSELLDFLSNSAPGGVPPPVKTEEIRLLHLGKLLEDGKTLTECNFSVGPGNETTVHISCRVPSNALEDAKDKLNKKSGACCILV